MKKNLNTQDPPFDKKVTLSDYIMSNRKVWLGFFAAVVSIALGVPWLKDGVDSSVFVMLGKASPAAMGLIGGILGASIIYAIVKSALATSFFTKDSGAKARNKEIVSRHIEKIKDKQSEIINALDTKIDEHKNFIKDSLQRNGFRDEDVEFYGEEICKQLKSNPINFSGSADKDISIKTGNYTVKFKTNTTGIKGYTTTELGQGESPLKPFDTPIKIDSYLADLIAKDTLIEGIGDVRDKLVYKKSESPKTIISKAIVESGLNGKPLADKDLVVKRLGSALDSEIRRR